MKNFTVIPNELFESSQLSIPSRYLLCLFLKYSGQDETCYPSQKTLARVMGFSDRYIRTLILELEGSKLIHKRRTGFNKSNTYTVSKQYRKSSSSQSNGGGNSRADELGSMFPLHQGSDVPPKSTYRKETSKRGSSKGIEILEEKMINIGLLNSKSVSSLKGENESEQ